MERPSLPVREVSPYQRVESMVHFRTSINLGFDVEVAGCMSKIGSDGEKSCDACIDVSTVPAVMFCCTCQVENTVKKLSNHPITRSRSVKLLLSITVADTGGGGGGGGVRTPPPPPLPSDLMMNKIKD